MLDRYGYPTYPGYLSKAEIERRAEARQAAQEAKEKGEDPDKAYTNSLCS